MSPAYWCVPAQELMRQLGSGTEGLSEREAARLLKARGPNEVAGDAQESAWLLVRRQFASPLVLILVFAAAVSMALRDWVEAGIVLFIVGCSGALGFLQEYRASTALARLRRRLALSSKVRRDGVVRSVPAASLVPGDVVLLSAGNLVPADGVVIAARDFLVTEASLTGESFPVEKRPGVLPEDTPLPARSNCAYLGTSVRSGTAELLVLRCGRDTELGTLSGRLLVQRPETEFARGLRQFGNALLRIMFVMVLASLTVNLLLARPALDALLFAVALAVGLSPELLPAIVTVTLSKGARVLSRRGVLVKRLEAVEHLGCIDVLCTDKTGTLTEGSMRLASAVDTDDAPSAEVRCLGCLNALFQTGIENPLDQALVAAAADAGVGTDGWRKLDEIPYDFIRRRLTVALADAEGDVLLVTKGAVSEVLAVCSSRARMQRAEPLGDAERASLLDGQRAAGERGLRVLAVAWRRVPLQPTYSHDDETGMTLAGFLLFDDPPRADAKAAVRRMADDGIALKVISGDNRHVCAYVARAVGIDAGAMLTGAEIAAMKDEALWQRAAVTSLFAEVDPQQKERIVRALQKRGHSVGYLGDGINDVPPLHAADVGISVDTAVDAARESADLVLLKHDLRPLHQGVLQGRRTFSNTLKYIYITTSASFGNMVSMALSSLFLPFLPLLAKQILLNNLLSDLPALAISTDRVDARDTARPQRWNMAELRRFMLVFGLLSTAFDLLTFALLLRVVGADEPAFRTAWFVISLLTELGVVLVLRTRGPVWRSRAAPMLVVATIAGVAAALVAPYAGWASTVFGFVPLPSSVLLVLLLVLLGYLGATEWAKGRFYRSACGHAGRSVRD